MRRGARLTGDGFAANIVIVMKRVVLLGLLFLCFQAFAELAPFDPDTPRVVLRLLGDGQQRLAEQKIQEALKDDHDDPQLAFWNGVLARARFQVDEAASPLLYAVRQMPNTPEGEAAACVLGIDFAADQRSALFFYNSLLAVGWQNPNSVPVHWLAAIMARTLTQESSDWHLTEETRKRILLCGVREYEAVLSLLKHGPGPMLVHQTLGNLLDALRAYDVSLKHRQISLSMERRALTMQASALTLERLQRSAEALPLALAAVKEDPEEARNHFTLAKILWKLGRHDEALQAGEKAAELYPYWNYFDFCATGHRFLGNYAAARNFTKRLLNFYPNDWAYQIWDARMAVLLNEPKAAERMFEAGLFDFNGKPMKYSASGKSEDPWFRAVTRGDTAIVTQMLGSVDINQRHQPGKETALMMAVCSGWEPIVRLLIQAGADLNLVDANGDTALHYSADFTQPRMMRLLLDAGAKTDFQDRWKQTALIMCADSKSWEGFDLLLQSKADVNLATRHGGTALHYACGWGDLPMILALLRAGADVNARCASNGWTPLMAAANSEWSHPHVLLPILNAGADPNLRATKNGRTALHLAIDPLMNKPLVELLLDKGANPALADNSGVTPITQARLLGFEETAKAMEKRIGQREPLRFPDFQIEGDNISKEEQNAAVYVFPLLLGEGHPLGRPSSVQPGDKPTACKELRRMFGIENAAELKEELQAMEEFEPRLRNSAGEVSAELGAQGTLIKNVVSAFQQSVCGGADEKAWTLCHIIYLSDLGVSAGFLTQEEGTARIVSAARQIQKTFPTLNEYLRSFQIGSRLHNGWDAQRYENICSQIKAADIFWP